jgi:hypothetical protein
MHSSVANSWKGLPVKIAIQRRQFDIPTGTKCAKLGCPAKLISIRNNETGFENNVRIELFSTLGRYSKLKNLDPDPPTCYKLFNHPFESYDILIKNGGCP